LWTWMYVLVQVSNTKPMLGIGELFVHTLDKALLLITHDSEHLCVDYV
jgi:hypothetical protein